jgi:DNA-binding NarL/FixJ family response regulator
MIKILIADDHILIREGFKKIIDQEVDMSVVAACQNAAEVMDFFSKDECDVAVLDINMPETDGLALLQDLSARKPKVKILMLSIHPEELFAIRALQAGASGYLTKKSAAEELVQAIRKVYYGGKHVSPALLEKLAFQSGAGITKAPHEKLSNREFQVFRLIAAGKTLHEITEILSLSLSSVNTHRRHILEKMNLKSTAEVIHYAIKNGLIE